MGRVVDGEKGNQERAFGGLARREESGGLAQNSGPVQGRPILLQNPPQKICRSAVYTIIGVPVEFPEWEATVKSFPREAPLTV